MSLYRPSLTVIQRLARRPVTARSSQIVCALSTEAPVESGPSSVGLTEDQLGFKAVADDFAAKELLPFAAKWDADKYFPVKTLRQAAELGFGGILVTEDVGEASGKVGKFAALS